MVITQNSLSKAPFAGHPAYDSDTRNYIPTPRPGPRIKPEAQDNADRNRGSLDLSWEGKRFESPRMQVATGRYCSLEGRENIIRNRGTLANILQSKGATGGTPREPVRCKATKPEATANAEQSKGGRMNLLLTNYGKNEVTPRPQLRVKPEAASNYTMSTGSAMSKVLHSPASLPVTYRPGPRIKPEAELNAMKNRGSMNYIMKVSTPRY